MLAEQILQKFKKKKFTSALKHISRLLNARRGELKPNPNVSANN